MKDILITLLRWVLHKPICRKYFYAADKRLINPLDLSRNKTKQASLPSGIEMILNLEEWIDRHIYFTGYYELYESQYLLKNLQPGQVFIDIGANIGYYSLLAAHAVQQDGRVISFEPFERNYECLKKNIELNKFSHITLVKKALSNQNENLKIHFDPNDKNAGMAQVSERGTYAVDAITLDDYVSAQDSFHVHFIKIDIEGHEYEALQGMKNTLNKYKPILMIEFDDEVFRDRENTIPLSWKLLIDLGYLPHEFDSQGELKILSDLPSKRNKNYIFTAYRK